MEFRILGPLEVIAEGQTLDLGGHKQRALLAFLLLEANRPVASERLIDALWEDEPTATAQKALQVYVSRLRKVLGGERLSTRPPGYMLSVMPDELDLERFERLRDMGELGEALSLWRGPPLDEFAQQRFARGAVARLDELRLACLEDRLDADIDAGRYAESVGELEALVQEQPLRERLRRQLMLALYRSGRQAEALEAYQAARQTLVEELGIEPGRALRDLHQAILNQEQTLDLPQAPAPSAEIAAAVPEASPPPCAEPAAVDVRKTITVVLVRVVVSSVHGQLLDPEALRRVMRRASSAVEAAVERHGGSLDSVAADTLTAVFGLPTVHEDDALRAARAARETVAELGQLAEELRAGQKLELDVRLALSTGEVVTSTASDTPVRATGEPFARAQRLAQVAEPGEVVFDDAARRLLRDAVVAEPEPVGQAWRLLALAAEDRELPGRFVSPMVGRERERDRLLDVFEQAVGDCSCQLFTVLGAAGVGKSRLVREFVGDVAGRARVAQGRCLPYGQGITYWPLLEAVKEAVGSEDADSPDEVRTKLISAVGESPGAERLARRVAEMIGLSDTVVSGDEGFAAVRELLEGLAQQEPVVVVFDDIHWAEARFLDLVEYLAEWTREAPLMLVCLARPELLELRSGWGGGKLNVTTTLLEPLSSGECAELIQNLVGESPLPEPAAARIVDAAEGNPLFVEEMLLMLIDEARLVRNDGRWSLTGDLGALRVPPTIQALLAARLDRLGPDERAVIERAAVAGKVFQEGAVRELSTGVPNPVVTEALRALVRKELIRPERAGLAEPTYRFRHLLIRDAAYDSIPKEVRAGLHERFGRWLERTAGDRAIEYEEVVGYHLEQAFRYRSEIIAPDDDSRGLAAEAAQRLGRAGRRAFVRSDASAGVNLISRAVALLARDDPRRVELVPNVRVIQGLGSDLGWADRVLTEAIEAAATTGDRTLAATALVQRSFLRLFTEPDVTADELIDVAERAIGVFEQDGDELGLARAWRLTAQAQYLGRRAGPCVDASERALEHAQRAKDVFEQREILEWLAIALFVGPTPAEEAVSRCEKLLQADPRDPVLEVHVLATLAFLVAMQDRTDEAHELISRARHAMEEFGEWIWVYSWHFAAICLWNDDPMAAERELMPRYESLKRLGEKSHFTSMTHALASAAYMQGRWEDAEQYARECDEASRANDVYSGIITRATRAKVLARRGDVDAAERLAEEAVALALDSDFVLARAEALADLGEVLELGHKPQEAAEAVEQAIRNYQLKGNLLGARRARTRLTALV